MRSAMQVPPVGALVVPAPEFRASMGTGEGAALLLSKRRGSLQLYYAGMDRIFWVPARQVRRIPSEAVSPGSREALLSNLLLALEAEECAFEETDSSDLAFSVEVAGMTDKDLEALREGLGERLRSFAIEPRNMHAIKLRLDLVSLPEPDSRGT